MIANGFFWLQELDAHATLLDPTATLTFHCRTCPMVECDGRAGAILDGATECFIATLLNWQEPLQAVPAHNAFVIRTMNAMRSTVAPQTLNHQQEHGTPSIIQKEQIDLPPRSLALLVAFAAVNSDRCTDGTWIDTARRWQKRGTAAVIAALSAALRVWPSPNPLIAAVCVESNLISCACCKVAPDWPMWSAVHKYPGALYNVRNLISPHWG